MAQVHERKSYNSYQNYHEKYIFKKNNLMEGFNIRWTRKKKKKK